MKKRGSEQIEEKKNEAQRAKPHTSIPAVDALIREEEQTRKKERTKEETESGSLTQLPWTLRSTPTTHRDHSEPIPVTPWPTRGIRYYYIRK